MEGKPPGSEGPDSSSIKPVSSLRSRFENIVANAKHAPANTGSPPAATSANIVSPEHVVPIAAIKRRPPTPPAARRSFDTGRPIVKPELQRPLNAGVPSRSEAASPAPGFTRRVAEHSPPRVDVTSPKSPPKPLDPSSVDPLQIAPSGPVAADPSRSVSRPPIPAARQFRVPSRTATPVTDIAPITSSARNPSESFQDSSAVSLGSTRPFESPNPPPLINRAAKPDIPTPRSAETTMLNHRKVRPIDTRRVSPFSTPPDSDDDNQDAGSAPIIPMVSKPRSSGLLPPHEMLGKDQATTHPPRKSSVRRSSPSHDRQRSDFDIEDQIDTRDARPLLPPRRDEPQRTLGREQGRSPIDSTRTSLESPARLSALAQGFSRDIPARKIIYNTTPVHDDQRPAMARSLPKRDYTSRSVSSIARSPATADSQRASDSEVGSRATHTTGAPASEFPDSSRLNRRPPCFRDGPSLINTGFDCRLLQASGDYVCASGNQTRVWSLTSGKLILSMAHGEQVKVTAIAFKPARKLEDDGLRLWLGTNWGELQELEISSKKVTAVNEHVHSRREVVEIHRRAAELWTIDQEGKLVVWPPDTGGSPDLDNGVLNGRVARGLTTSIVVGEELWLATGKSIWIYRPSANPDKNAFQATQQSFTLANVGDMISSAIIPSQQDRVYFGHTDGKISLFSRIGAQHIETVSVNLYRINCLAGVHDRLWVGYNTGMIHVYNTKSRPWTITKSWLSHDHPVLGLKVDRHSLWKQDRMHVVSLGVDDSIGVWDGLAEEDWLDDELKRREAEFCSYRDISALILTWNAGAAKPADLRHDEEDANFFRELLRKEDAPDIIVFGLQELVDLDDKKLTAKSFFKGKSKDSYGQEHLSSVYRAWRDYLTGCLDQSTTHTDAYTQLHTSSLVGLFSCIFVKAASRARIRDVHATEVKTGMGGLHGNKGALLVRFILDDTSLCFVNCHLAAGQTQTVNRNHDVASILDAEQLPASRGADLRNGTYVYGGDGTMIVDHEICVLNGDLNYRIDTMSRDTVLQAIKTRNLSKLLDRDQLLLSRRKNPGNRLRDFTEAPLTFLPTYKYDVGTDNYDSSDKRRAPAWCDRVFHRGGEKVKQLEYRRHEVRVSDHRPVSASFVFKIKTVKPELRARWVQKTAEKFNAHRQQVSEQAKLEYLIEVFDIEEDEAQRLLKG